MRSGDLLVAKITPCFENGKIAFAQPKQLTRKSPRYKLFEGDLLFTEGGDPDKLGRGTLWRSELPSCIHEWSQDVTVPMLEVARRRLRLLIKLIERRSRKVVYSDFEDEIGESRQATLAGSAAVGTDFERFKAKARVFLLDHEDRLALQKLRRNRPLTAADLAELERMLHEAGGSAAHIEQARKGSAGLGLFIRSLVGLEAHCCQGDVQRVPAGKTRTASQIEFIDLVVDHLTEQGAIDLGRLYESPFTDLSPAGPEALFEGADVDKLIHVLGSVKRNAA